nr:glycosyl transferase family 1 [Actinomycetota bacterium]
MEHISDVPIGVLRPQRFKSVLEPEAWALFEGMIDHARELFDGRVIWNVNSTAHGGGVAEMLRSLLTYSRGADVDARWVVIDGNDDFFRVTKRIHNMLHGAPGDGGPLGDEERDIYERALKGSAEELASLVRKDDVVILHDPQTAGLTKALTETGATIIWRCHVGLDNPNEVSRSAWNFLRPYMSAADAYIFSRKTFVWDDLDGDKIHIIAPSIDAFSPKNQELDPATVA